MIAQKKTKLADYIWKPGFGEPWHKNTTSHRQPTTPQYIRGINQFRYWYFLLLHQILPRYLNTIGLHKYEQLYTSPRWWAKIYVLIEDRKYLNGYVPFRYGSLRNVTIVRKIAVILACVTVFKYPTGKLLPGWVNDSIPQKFTLQVNFLHRYEVWVLVASDCWVDQWTSSLICRRQETCISSMVIPAWET